MFNEVFKMHKYEVMLKCMHCGKFMLASIEKVDIPDEGEDVGDERKHMNEVLK